MMGARIAALRRDAGWSQAELGKRLRVSASAVGMYEQGRREPALDMVVTIAELFGVTTDYLLTGKTQTPQESQIVGQTLLSGVTEAEQKLQLRNDRPFTRQELAVLFAAILTEP